MRYSGAHLMSLCLMVISAGVVITALKWPFRAALFPVIIGISVFFMAIAELLLNLFGKKEMVVKEAAVDFSLSEGMDKALEIRRTLVIFAWIVGFFGLIIFFGFTIAVPLFVFLYLKLQGKEGWGISLIFSVSAWVFFYGLFIWLLNTPFQEGWVVEILRKVGAPGP